MSKTLAFFLDSFMVLFSKVVRESVKLFQVENEELPERDCPACGSRHLIKNGWVHNGKPKYQCKSCGRQFVVNPTKTTVSQEIKQLIERLLLERISLLWNCQNHPDKFVLVTRLSESKASSYSPPAQGFRKITRSVDHWMWWNVVVCQQQEKRGLYLASNWP